MNYLSLTLALALCLPSFSCRKRLYPTNGETIYKTGRNKQGEKMLDEQGSRFKIIKSCKTCHGKNGDGMSRVSIKWSYLSDPQHLSVPYSDSLFFRFLDQDLKSDGNKANIGVRFKMKDQDKKDLLAYLKTL